MLEWSTLASLSEWLGDIGGRGSANPAVERSLGVAYALLFVAGVVANFFLFQAYHRRPTERKRAENRLLWRPWSWLDAAHITLFLTASLLIGSSLASGLDGIGWIDLEAHPILLILIHSLSLHGAAILFVAALMAQRRFSWVTCFAHRRWTWLGGFGGGLIAYIAIIPFLFTYAILYQLWLRTAGQEARLQDAIHLFSELTDNSQRLVFIFVAVVLAPVSEELLFRGIVLPALGRIWGMGAAIALSSALFALIHLHAPSLVPLFVLSIGLSLAYVYSKSLLVPISMHMVFNAVSLATVSILPI